MNDRPNPSPKMSDVAKAAGVSSMTVSRAFRKDGSISDARRAEIMRIADEMGYIFDKGASELRTKRSGFVAVTVPSINNPNFADTVAGLTECLADHGLEALFGYTDYRIDKEEELIRQLLRRRPEAMLVTGSNHTPRTRKRLAEAGVPVIECWDKPEDPIQYSVGFASELAGQLMADHLVAKGYRKVAFIGGDANFDTRGDGRRIGFTKRLDEHGIDPTRAILVGSPPVATASGARGARQLLETWPDTDAVMCVADSAAFGAMTEFQRNGLSVPDDIAVCGFGAFDVGAYSIPSITTIEPNAAAIGTQVGKLLASLLREPDSAVSTQHIDILPTLLERSST